MKRALLVFNPEAAGVAPRVRDVIARALATELKLDIAETKRRHHATHLAQGAAHEGFELVVVLGGDGTLNEVVNGLAGTDVPIAPLPGGGTNVFARTMGLPKDPIEATSVVLERLKDEPRRIDLGRVNGRAFAFCAGVGFDAAIVRAVERRARLKKHIGEPYFVFQAVRTFYLGFPRRRASMTLDGLDGVRTALVCNSDPYTFFRNRPLRACPEAGSDTGLDVTAFTKFTTPVVLRSVARAFSSNGLRPSKHVRALHDLDSFTITSEQPLPYQVDGDLAGEDTTFVFERMPRALSVLS